MTDSDQPSNKQVFQGVKVDPSILFNDDDESWYAVPRIVIESMPLYWQSRLIKLHEDIGHKYPHWRPYGNFTVSLKQDNKFAPLPEEFKDHTIDSPVYKKV